MILTAQLLKQISPGTPLERLQTFVPHLNIYLPAYEIDTPIEIASYLAQVLHESGGFRWLREIWGPTKQQRRYERDFKQEWSARNPRNRLAFRLGNEVKGDGKKFAGHGLIHTTGRYNHLKESLEMFKDDRLLDTPELLCTPVFAVWSSVIYWQRKKLDKVDDDLNILQETKLVNGGYNGLDDRQNYFDRAVDVFKIVIPDK